MPCSGPRYHLLAHTTLTLAAVQDGFRTHDLTLASHGEYVCAWVMLDGGKRGCWVVPSSSFTLTLHLLSPRGAPCLAAPLWQCVLPPGGSASLHDPAYCKWFPQGAGEGP